MMYKVKKEAAEHCGCVCSVQAAGGAWLPAKFKLSAVKGEGLPQLPVLIHIPNSALCENSI